MKVSYDRVADAIYIYLTSAKIVESETIYPDLVYDYDENNLLVGVEILGIQKRTSEQLKDLLNALTPEIREVLKDFSTSLSALSV